MKIKIFYGWWIVLTTNIICMIGYGIWLYSFGVFFKPMATEFGWTRAMTAGAYSLRSVQGGIASPLVGWGVDKYGARIIIQIGAFVSGLSLVLMPLVNSLSMFYLIYGIFLSAGMSAMLYLPAWTVIAKWFRRRLSLALAILTTGAGFGGIIWAPVSSLLISHFGWRTAFVILGVIIWGVVIPISFLIRNDPADCNLQPDGDETLVDQPTTLTKSEKLPNEFQDITLVEALHSSTFWTMAAAFFFFSMTHATVTVHLVPALTDIGISTAQASLALGLLTLISVIGRLTFGFLGDYLNKRYLFIFLYTMMASAMFVLMNAETLLMVYLFIIIFGVGFGGTVPLMPAIRAEYFGREALGKIQGFMDPANMCASAIGPIIAGLVFDFSGSYRMVFLITGLLTFMACIAMFFTRPMLVIRAD